MEIKDAAEAGSKVLAVAAVDIRKGAAGNGFHTGVWSNGMTSGFDPEGEGSIPSRVSV